MDSILTVAEVAKLLRLSTKTVRIYCRAQKIRAQKPGGVWLIPEAEIARWLQLEEPSRVGEGAG